MVEQVKRGYRRTLFQIRRNSALRCSEKTMVGEHVNTDFRGKSFATAVANG